MQQDVLREARTATTQCPNACACLETGRCGQQPLCAGDRLLSDRVLCIHAEAKRACPYQLHFPYAQFCICPLRVALWREFGNHWLGTRLPHERR